MEFYYIKANTTKCVLMLMDRWIHFINKHLPVLMFCFFFFFILNLKAEYLEIKNQVGVVVSCTRPLCLTL